MGRAIRTVPAIPPRSSALGPESAPSPPGRRYADIFVGRETEMAILRSAVEDALGGQGRVVLIAGEPGIGKTRTAQELATHARRCGMHVLWGRCHEGGGAPAYWPWVQAIRAYVEDRTPQELRADMGSGAPDIANVVPGVRERLPDLPASPRLEPEQERFRLFDSVTMFLKRGASRRALMLVIDDLHWADTPSLLLLQFLARELESAPMIVVATYRDEAARPEGPLLASLAELARTPASRRMALTGLSEAEIAQLIEHAGGEKPSAALISAVARQTEGNPFFVGELVRWLTARGQLHAMASGSTGVPPSVREVIVRRLQRLSPACNALLASAAVVGRDFPLALLARVLGRPQEDLVELAEEAVAARVLTESSDEAGRYGFVHALIRETLYGELNHRRRRRVHQLIGEGLESLYAARLDHHLPALAHHFSEAASPESAEKAIAYGQRAGDRAMTLTAYEDAVSYYERVLRLLERPENADDRRRAEVLLGLGKATFGCGKPLVEAQIRYLEVAAIARQVDAPELLARAALQFAFGPRLPGVETRAQLLEEAHAALSGDDTVLHARVLARLAFDLARRSGAPERVAALCDEAVAIARRHEDPDALGYVLLNAASAHWRPDTFPRRLEWLEELTALYERVDDTHLELQVHLLAVVTFVRLGDRTSLESAVEAYIRCAEELRVPYFLFMSYEMRAMLATMSGRFDEAERRVQEAIAVGGTIDPEIVQLLFGGLISLVRWQQGRIAEIEPLITGVVDREPQTPLWRAALAWLHCEVGRTESARQELAVIFEHDLATLPTDPNSWLVTIGLLAEVSAAVGDERRASVLAEILQPYARMCLVGGDTICFGAAARHLGLLAATMRRWNEACRYFDDALAINTALRAPSLVARTRYDYASMLLQRDASGDRAKALGLLRAAIDTAEHLGMKAVLESAVALELRIRGGSAATASIDAVTAAEVAVTRRPSVAVLHDEGDYWTLTYDGTTSRLKDGRGHHYLARLLRHPGREFHVLDLARGASVADPGAETSGVVVHNRGLEILDAAAKSAYRHRLADLRQELEEAEGFNDAGRVTRVREEIDAIGAQLAAAFGLGRRDRETGSATERARSTVTQRIRWAIKRIATRHPALADHLTGRVETGTYCAYRPDPARSIEWDLDEHPETGL